MSQHGFRTRTVSGSSFYRRRRSVKLWQKCVMFFHVILQRIRRHRTRSEWKIAMFKAVGIVTCLSIFLLGILWITLPNIDDPRTMFPAQSTVIVDRNGVELYRLFSGEDRTYVDRRDISPFIQQAIIAIEDQRYMDRRSCLDVTGLLRAAVSQVLPGVLVRSGGSTLPQQFAKNALVGSDKSIVRKLREIMLSCALQQRYNKEQLLELYLNWIPFGHNAYGIEQAAKKYYGVSASKLSLAQSSILAAMIQRPSYFNPYGKHVYTVLTDEAKDAIKHGDITSANQLSSNDISIGLIGRTVGSGAGIYVGGRTDQVLRNMQDQGMIRDDERIKALAELQVLTFKRDREDIRAPHFVLQVQRDVQQLLGISDDILEQGGFRIQTTLDWNLQEIAERIVRDRREDIQKRFGASNIALVALSPVTREVLAYVGNADFSDDEHQGKIDMVRSPRQPGSSFKAFTYLMAFDAGYGPGSIVYDVPTKFGEDQPQNFDGTFWGPITMRRALAGSRNIPAIKAFFLGGGEEALLRLTRSLGVQTPSLSKAERRQTSENVDYGWPLSIGAAETPLYEMVQGYASIADGGVYRPVTAITKITDQHGSIRYLAKETQPERVVDERSAALVTSVLSDVQARPNEYWQSILSVPGFAAAAKTGTSNKCLERDSNKNCTLRRPESLWTVGFTPNLITGVWVGNATSQSLFEKADGLTAAAPIWHDFMIGAHRKIATSVTTFIETPGIAHPLLSGLSGVLASSCTPIELRTADLIQTEHVPSNTDDPACAVARVDKLTNLLASDECPADAAEERTFFVPRSELPLRWPLWEKGVQDWAAAQMELWNKSDTHSGSVLKLPVLPTKKCTLADTPGRLQKPTITLQSPAEKETITFPSFTPSWTTTGAPIHEIRVALDDRTIATFTQAPFVGPVRIPRSIDGGSHLLTVTLTDMYFNTAKVTRQVLVEESTR